MEQFNGLRIVDMEALVRLREGVREEESERVVEIRTRRSSGPGVTEAPGQSGA